MRRTDSGGTDADGNAVPGEVTIDTVCDLQQVSTQERAEQGETSDTTWTIFFGPDEALHSGDAVRIEDEEYELTGDPWRVRGLGGTVDHVEARARQTIGPGDEVGS